MKNLTKLLIPAALMAAIFISCDKDGKEQIPEIITIDFEAVPLLGSTGGYTDILWGREKAQPDADGNNVYDGILYTEDGASFGSYFNDYAGGDWPMESWGGFAFSSNNIQEDTESLWDLAYQFSAYAQEVSKFAVAYDFGGYNGGRYERPFITFDREVTMVSARVANTNKGYHYCVRNENKVEDLYFALTITGYNGGAETGDVTVELARKGGFLSDWTDADLAPLGKVDRIGFSFDGNDTDEWGLRIPAFFCIDDIKFHE